MNYVWNVFIHFQVVMSVIEILMNHGILLIIILKTKHIIVCVVIMISEINIIKNVL